ncbi:MAG: VWA domain-containing protein, partial [Thermoanaerobaculia bacterium]
DFQRGYVRFSAQIEGGEVAEVAFFVEGEPVMTKTRPPFSVDLSVGDLETLSVRAVAYDAAGGEIATDEMLVNAGDYAFAVRLIEPRNGSQVVGASVRVRARVETPVDGRLERVEFFVNDQRVTTLFQPPFSAEVLLDGDALTVIRALAFLDDGNSAEAVAIVNSAQYLETVDVRLVEVFASVLDDSGRPIAELDRDAFQVLENGSEQAILRFERLEDLPIHVGLMIDTSASMAERIVPVKDAAVRFLEQAVRPQDRASVITFDEQPRMAAAFTNDLTTLIGALAGLRTGRGTALYDCLLFSLYSFRGLTGQRALLLLSDGEDRRSRSTFDEVREFALRSGVTIYTIGLRKGMTRRGKSELVRLADETGGRAFLIEDIPELDAIYEAIQKDLRSKYFLAYQPSTAEGRGFRTIEIRVDRPGVEVRALRGYLPRSSG